MHTFNKCKLLSSTGWLVASCRARIHTFHSQFYIFVVLHCCAVWSDLSKVGLGCIALHWICWPGSIQLVPLKELPELRRGGCHTDGREMRILFTEGMEWWKWKFCFHFHMYSATTTYFTSGSGDGIAATNLVLRDPRVFPVVIHNSGWKWRKFCRILNSALLYFTSCVGESGSVQFSSLHMICFISSLDEWGCKTEGVTNLKSLTCFFACICCWIYRIYKLREAQTWVGEGTKKMSTLNNGKGEVVNKEEIKNQSEFKSNCFVVQLSCSPAVISKSLEDLMSKK